MQGLADGFHDASRNRGWVRSGCSQCKRRKKKCNEDKPRCGHCTRLGLECDYGSIWKTPNTPSNKPLRRKRQASSRELSFSTDGILPGASPGLLEAWIEANVDPPSGPLGTTATTPAHGCTSPLLLPCVNPLSALGHAAVGPGYSYYLSYYISHISRLLVMADTSSNPLRQTVIPRLASSPMLLKAVCVVSACHLAQRQGHEAASDHSTFVLRNYSQLLSSLSAALPGYARADQCLVDQIILTTVFLCKYEIIRGSTREWRHHLTGLMQLLKHPVTILKLSRDTRKYMESFITYHCEVAAITSGGSGDSRLVLDAAIPVEDEEDSEIDTYMGFTKSIVELFGRISKLSHQRSSRSAIAEAILIYEKLQTWTIADEARLVPSGVPLSSVQYLRSAAVAYHSSAIIYFFSITAAQFPSARTWPWDRAALSKRAAAMHCFDALRDIPDGMPSESALVLPLFIMGCESEFPEQQAYAIDRLRRLETTVFIGNIGLARVIVEQVRENAAAARLAGVKGPRWSSATDSLGWDLIVT